MLRKLALLLLPLALFVAACGSDNNGGDPPVDATSQPTEPAGPTSAPPSSQADPTAIVIATPDLGGGPIDLDGDLSDPGVLINTINPLSLLNSFDSGTATDGISPQLAGQLLSQNDLPAGFAPLGNFNMSIPGPTGTTDMSMTMFASDEFFTEGQFGTMVISAAIVLPPEARAELEQGGLEELAALSDADLDEMMAAQGLTGLGITEIGLLDASGLGEAGLGMHMAMDFSDMFGAFGAPEGGAAMAGIAMDMYMFFEGDLMYLVVTMYPSDSSSDVDARQLADILDSRT